MKKLKQFSTASAFFFLVFTSAMLLLVAGYLFMTWQQPSVINWYTVLGVERFIVLFSLVMGVMFIMDN